MKVAHYARRAGLAILVAHIPLDAPAQTAPAVHTLSISVVDSATHAPLPGSQVLIASSRLAFVVPSSGIVTFDLNAPISDTITVRRLGYNPVVFAVALKPRETTSLLVSLGAAAQTLPEVSIAGTTELGLLKNGFYDRRKRSSGFFVGPDEIEQRKPARLSDLLSGDPQIRFSPAASGGRTIRFARAQNCPPVVYVDGVQFVNERTVSRLRPFARGTQRTREASDDVLSQQDQGIDEISVRQVAAVEAYSSATHAPPQYASAAASCGVLLVWTAAFFANSR